MKEFLILYLLITGAIFSPNQPPNKWQVADAAWLSNKIYEGINTMDTDFGYVFKSHESDSYGAYAVWKQKKSGECYVIIRGTKTIGDIFTDLDVAEVYDDEIDVKVHHGVRTRTKFIIEDIGDKLKICTDDIVIAGHSLGGSISYYLYLLYVKRHLEDWGQKAKASRFKAVLFATPALTTKSGRENLANFDNYVHWYKYERDFVPYIVSTVKNSLNFLILSLLLSALGMRIVKEAYLTIKTVSYGYHHPGHRYQLKDGEIKEYDPMKDFCFPNPLAIEDHKNFYKSVDILTKIWYNSNLYNAQKYNNTLDCSQFLNEEDKGNNQENSSDDETIDINSVDCEDVNDFVTILNFTNAILYMKNETDYSSYIVKRLLDNEKEYEYAMCIDKRFILKQCNGKCQCHEVIKNDRPKEIAYCNSFKIENTMNCFVDGNYKEIGVTDYFSVIRQVKIDDHYLMDYFCWNQTYLRGNYKIEEKNVAKMMNVSKSVLFLLFFLL